MRPHRPHRRPTVHTGLLGAISLLLVALCATSCDEYECSDGEHPVKAVGSKTGGYCAKDGDKPDRGFVTYPPGKVPNKVGDKWDVYWEKVIVDRHGRVVGKYRRIPQPTD